MFYAVVASYIISLECYSDISILKKIWLILFYTLYKIGEHYSLSAIISRLRILLKICVILGVNLQI